MTAVECAQYELLDLFYVIVTHINDLLCLLE